MRLSDGLECLAGVGRKRKDAFAALGINTIYDLLHHLPLRYEDRRRPVPSSRLKPGRPALVRVRLDRAESKRSSRGLTYLTAELSDGDGPVSAVWFGSWVFGLLRSVGSELLLYGTPNLAPSGMQFKGPLYQVLKAGSPAQLPPETEWNRIVPIYGASGALPRRLISSLIYETVNSAELEAPDSVPTEALLRRNLLPLSRALRGIHAPISREEIILSRQSLAYAELFRLQASLLDAKKSRATREAPSLALGQAEMSRLSSSLPFPLTASQRLALDEIAADLTRSVPMRRLLQGDVGSGKTVVAVAAAAMALGAGYQAAILAPTVILAEQLRSVAAKLLAPLGHRVLAMTGDQSARERRDVLSSVAGNDPLLLVGTHALLEESVTFGRLALAVIDEQHRFGVEQRAALTNKGKGVHTLAMSATPIPRTLCLALYGDIETSSLREKPSGRQAVITRVVPESRLKDVYAYVGREIAKGGRCFWICPFIGDEEEGLDGRAADISAHLPNVRVARLHGRMKEAEKRSSMELFAAGSVDLVVSTTVVEVGVDVPEASLIIIEKASCFGLSQLHQLRGRVGRGEVRGVCILLSDPDKTAVRRLSILANNDDGFAIAEEDLRLRGSGELSGLRQHGQAGLHIADIHKDAKLLNWACADVILFEKTSHL